MTPDKRRIRQALSDETLLHLHSLDVFDEIGSTNTWLLDEQAAPAGKCQLAVADNQTAGRGRRDRRWVSRPGSSLCLSMAYTFQSIPDNLPSLTLALGLAIAKKLNAMGNSTVMLKWPNDLMVGEQKLGGILTESQVRSENSIRVVAGIGINLNLPEAVLDAVASERDQAPTSLGNFLVDLPDRDELAGMVANAMFTGMTSFDAQGFSALQQEFARVDWLARRLVSLSDDAIEIEGVSHGIDATGALILSTADGLRHVRSGSIVSASRQDDPHAV